METNNNYNQNQEENNELTLKQNCERLYDLWYQQSKIELERSRRLEVFRNLHGSKTCVESLLNEVLKKNRRLVNVDKKYEEDGGFGNENMDYPYKFPLTLNHLEAIDILARLYLGGKNENT
ncbi:MAG: hypothetical protein ACP5OG_04100 [Candidatus Nanoarchaeia archaeon]